MGFTADMEGAVAKIRRIATSRPLGLFLASEAARGMNPYVPFRSGALSHSASLAPFEIVYNTPYARKVFYGQHLRFSKDQHALATARWDRAYAAAHGEALGRAGTRYLKDGGQI